MVSVLAGSALNNLAPRHIQALFPTSLQAYTTWMQRMRARRSLPMNRLKPHVVPLPVKPGASLLWMGDVARATKFVLFPHGGGYTTPLNTGQLTWSWNAFVGGALGKRRVCKEEATESPSPSCSIVFPQKHTTRHTSARRPQPSTTC
ncbi:hypothetical protein IMZ48_24645 [Candidatus Bathyarchaeota archaeon]|nr:hypothetical protein [Candidatus Bathyarchaeota archaeon]